MSYRVIVPSRDAGNLLAYLSMLQEREPDLDPARVSVIDDGVTWDAIDAAGPWFRAVHRLKGDQPFVFARNVNLGLKHARDLAEDAVVMNDDALLRTPKGLTTLERIARENPEYGIVSAAADSIGNANQVGRGTGGLRGESRMLCFVCVYLPLRVFAENPGLLDERYVDYGLEDDDYCRQVLAAGYKLGVADAVEVDHSTLVSSYRGRSRRCNIRPNLRRFIEKWGVDNWGRDASKSRFAALFSR